MRPSSAPQHRQNTRWRSWLTQAVFIATLIGLLYLLSMAAADRLNSLGIQTGFAFLQYPAGFDIGESLIPYDGSDSYGWAFVVGLLNTLRVGVFGILLAAALGLIVGFGRLSKNNVIAGITASFVEITRNVPVLVHLFLWYALITIILPGPRSALDLGGVVYLSNRGLVFPAVRFDLHLMLILFAVIFCFLAAGRLSIAKTRWIVRGAILALTVGLLGLTYGTAYLVEIPELVGFDFAGGLRITPEFLALWLGLGIYTSGFIAEIVRGSIQAVPRGQNEASQALGLSRAQTMRLVILQQALRIAVPPSTNQFLNLVKNSSLAVAIGYSDLVSVGNTTMNQTGQAIEAIFLFMMFYFFLSISISTALNFLNHRLHMQGR